MSELSPETRAFIDSAARGDAPSLEDRARVRQRLSLELGAAAIAATGLTVAAQGTASAAGSALSASVTAGAGGKATFGAGMISKWLMALGVASAMSTGAVVVVLQASEPEAPPARAGRAVATAAKVEPVAPPDALAVEAPTPDAEQLVQSGTDTGSEPGSATVMPASKRKARASESAHAQVAQASLAEETALLRQAQLALKDGKPEVALIHASEHARRFASGVLSEEREAVSMLARCALGPLDANALAAYLGHAAESPLKARVQKACQSKP